MIFYSSKILVKSNSIKGLNKKLCSAKVGLSSPGEGRPNSAPNAVRLSPFPWLELAPRKNQILALVHLSHFPPLRCPKCTAAFYPTTAPVGIVSIGDPSTDTLLLIRQPRYPPGILSDSSILDMSSRRSIIMWFCTGMYSCIAGFMDPGEPLEECVRREVAEEVAYCPTEYIWM